MAKMLAETASGYEGWGSSRFQAQYLRVTIDGKDAIAITDADTKWGFTLCEKNSWTGTDGQTSDSTLKNNIEVSKDRSMTFEQKTYKKTLIDLSKLTYD